MRRLIAISALATCVMALWVYWQDMIATVSRQTDEVLKHAGTDLPLLADLSTTQVYGLRILRSGEPPIFVLRGSDGKWSMQLPENFPADGYQIERLLGNLQQLTIIRRLPPENVFSGDFGLDSPSLVVELESNRGLKRLIIGNEAPVGEGVFIALNGDKSILLVAKEPLARLPRSPDELLDRHPVPLIRDPLHTIKVQSRGNSLLLRGSGEGWHIESPVQISADPRVMTEWLTHLTSLEALRVFRNETGIDKTFRREGVLELAAGNVFHSLEVGWLGKRLIGRRSDKPNLYYELVEGELVWLFPDSFRLYDKHLIHMRSEDIAAAVLRHAGKSIRIERGAKGWMWQGVLLPEGQAEELLQWIRELQLAEATEMVADLKQCQTARSPEWRVGLEHPLNHVSTQLILSRTPGCGDVAAITSGFHMKLADTAVIDRLEIMFLFNPPVSISPRPAA
jgi:hypothetical protein